MMKFWPLIYKDLRLLFSNKSALGIITLPFILVLFFSLPIPQNDFFRDKTMFFAMMIIVPISFSITVINGAVDFELATHNVLLHSGYNFRSILVSKILSSVIALAIIDFLLILVSSRSADSSLILCIIVLILAQLPLIIFAVVFSIYNQSSQDTNVTTLLILIVYAFPPMFAIFPTNHVPDMFIRYIPTTQFEFLFYPEVAVSFITLIVWFLFFMLISSYYYKKTISSTQQF